MVMVLLCNRLNILSVPTQAHESLKLKSQALAEVVAHLRARYLEALKIKQSVRYVANGGVVWPCV